MHFGHLLTRSGLTRLKVSLMVSPGSFCLLVCSFLILSSVIYYWGILFVCCNQFLLYPCILSKTGVILVIFAISLFYNLSKFILLVLSYISSLLLLLLLFFLRLLV